MHYICTNKPYEALTHVEVQDGLHKAHECLDQLAGSVYKDAIYDDYCKLERHPNKRAKSEPCGCPVERAHL